MTTLEIIITIGAISALINTVLQISWFIWTLRNHSHKHIENDDIPEDYI